MAIGSRLGRNFACTYMRKTITHESMLGRKLMDSNDKPYFYKKFIDDGLGIWTKGIEKLREFANHANNIHTDIKIKLRWNEDKIAFLDTWVKLENGKVSTDFYI